MQQILIKLTLSICAVLSLISCSKGDTDTSSAKDKTPPVYISSAKVTSQLYHPYVDAIGHLQAHQTAALSIESSGVVKSIQFKSGQTIQAGSPLLVLDHSMESAKLDAVNSEYRESKHLWQRSQKLHKTHAISTAELEKTRTQFVKAESAKRLLETQIKQKTLYAPFSGKLGFKHTEIGEYITPAKIVVKLLALNPMRIVFSVPEQYFPFLKQDQDISFKTDPYPNQTFKAKISAIDIETLDSSHLISVEGVVDNSKQLLYPGLFSQIKLYYKKPMQVLTIPKTAVNYNLYGNSVYTIHCQSDNECEALEKFVTLGASIGDDVIVTSGLKQDQEVIASGQLKVHNHSPVIINNEGEQHAAKDKSAAKLTLNRAPTQASA